MDYPTPPVSPSKPLLYHISLYDNITLKKEDPIMDCIKDFLLDLLRCLKYAVIISLFVNIISFVFFISKYGHINPYLLNYFSKNSYYIGCFILFISIWFFIKPSTLRPLDYQNEWNRLFHKLSLAFVVMFTGLFICCIGMFMQYIYELRAI